MATHDYVIANGTGAAVRSDLNGALAAIVSNNSGATEPGTMYAYQWWPDTTTGLLKQRNAANNAWVTVGTLASANLGLLSLAGGTMTGALAVTAGTAALPGIAVSGDLNTGITSPGADQLAISTGGTSRLAVSTTAVSSTLAVDVPLGAVGTPSLTFTGDLNTGVFSPGADQVAITTGGTARLNADTAAVTSTLPVVHPLGAVGTPSITFTGDLNTGIWSPAADTIAFSEGGDEAMRIDASSRLLIGTVTGNANGGILQLTSGITFPATAVAASDANTLDDYEEGTWTPVIADASTGGNAGTATVDQSSYTRIGNIVTIQMYIYNLNTTGMTGANRLYIRGFPFVAAKRSTGAFYTYRVTRDAGTVSSSSMIANGSSSIYFHVFTTNGATGDRFILVSDIVGAPTEIMFTNTYQV